MSGPNAAASSGSSVRSVSSQTRSPLRGRERHVDRGPGRDPLPRLVGEPGPREERHARLVDRDRHDARVVPVDRLDPVAVVHVEIDVEHPQAVASGPRDRQRDIVVDAEARRPGRHRVMQPAAGMEGVVDLASQDRLHRPDRAAGHHRGGVMHAGERRVVAAHGDPGLRWPVRCRREPLHDLDVGLVVAPRELVVGRRLGLQPRDRADRAEQVDPRPEAAGRQRVARPEVIGGRARPVHEEHACHHTGDGTRLHDPAPRQARRRARDARRAHRHRGRRDPPAAGRPHRTT